MNSEEIKKFEKIYTDFPFRKCIQHFKLFINKFLEYESDILYNCNEDEIEYLIYFSCYTSNYDMLNLIGVNHKLNYHDLIYFIDKKCLDCNLIYFFVENMNGFYKIYFMYLMNTFKFGEVLELVKKYPMNLSFDYFNKYDIHDIKYYVMKNDEYEELIKYLYDNNLINFSESELFKICYLSEKLFQWLLDLGYTNYSNVVDDIVDLIFGHKYAITIDYDNFIFSLDNFDEIFPEFIILVQKILSNENDYVENCLLNNKLSEFKMGLVNSYCFDIHKLMINSDSYKIFIDYMMSNNIIITTDELYIFYIDEFCDREKILRYFSDNLMQLLESYIMKHYIEYYHLRSFNDIFYFLKKIDINNVSNQLNIIYPKLLMVIGDEILLKKILDHIIDENNYYEIMINAINVVNHNMVKIVGELIPYQEIYDYYNVFLETLLKRIHVDYEKIINLLIDMYDENIIINNDNLIKMINMCDNITIKNFVIKIINNQQFENISDDLNEKIQQLYQNDN